MEGDSCLQTKRVWQKHGEGVDPSGEESPSQVGRGLCRSLIQGWALVPSSEPLARSAEALAAPQSPASHLPSSNCHLDGPLASARSWLPT